MKTLIGWILFAAAFLVRIPLILIGLPAVGLSMLGDGKRHTPAMWKFWADAENTPVGEGVYWYWAIRNPTRGFKFTQPEPELHPNPDFLVYNLDFESASRSTGGLQPEYWYLRQVGDKKFEFRIGWKYTTGGHIKFGPTIQLRYGS